MDHLKIYNSIIEKAQLANRKKLRKNQLGYVYYEKHHIMPKCLGGSNEPENLVLLTAREHYICHKLLTYIYPKTRGLWLALKRFMHSKKLSLYNISSKDYALIKESLKLIPPKSHYKIWLEKYGKEEADKLKLMEIEKIKKTMTGVKYSEERRKNSANGHIGIKMSKETCNKKRISMIGKNKGKHHSEEIRKKCGANRKGKTYEELFGFEKAAQLKHEKSEMMKIIRKKQIYGK